MNAIKLVRIFGEMGCLFFKNEINDALNYFQKMLESDRIVYILNDDKPHAFLFISITDEPEKFLNKSKWDYLDHDERGKTVCVEKLISKSWDKDTRMLFERLIVDRYPQIESGIWYRWKKHGDHKMISKRRKINV